MRVMVIARLFSGLADSLAERRWRPTGVPAIYKLLEALAARPDVELMCVFACKDAHDGRFRRPARFALAPLGEVAVLPWAPRPWLARLGLDGKLREAAHLLRCLWLWLRFRPDVAYVTNANFVVAGTLARLGARRVILRLLGLHPEQQRLAEAGGGFQRWFYRAPFARVICTLEGSGGDYYLPRLLAPGVPYEVLLNGVDPAVPDGAVRAEIVRAYPPGGPPVVLFVGRLEWNKGCREFVDAILRLLAARPGALAAVLVGDGSLRPEIEEAIGAAGAAGAVHLVGAVPHGTVAAWLERADIYVSLNLFGNLSNANLEALAAGKCMVILDADPGRHIDEETARLLPAGTVVRIGRNDIAANLARALGELLDDPGRRCALAAAAAALAPRLVEGWEARIEREIAMIEGA